MSQIRTFNKEYLDELLERDGATIVEIPEKLHGGTFIIFQCTCGITHHKLFRDISYYAGAFCKECCKKNKAQKTRDTCIINFGVINPSCAQEIKDKKIATYMGHYGMHPSKTEEVRAKYRETCMMRYNVDNASKVPEIKEKIKEIFNERYDGHPMYIEAVKEKVKDTCIQRFGGHPAQSQEIQEKIQKSGKKYKPYTMPSGEIRQIQGYEHFALDILLKEYTAEQIKSNRSEVPRIIYEINEESKYYFPDIYIPHKNLIIEVKSTWTYQKEEEKNQIKAAATRVHGYEFEFWIFDLKGIRVETPT